MSFVVYDLVFLALFTLFVTVFLYSRRSNLKRQGLLYLYRTRFGLEIIETTAVKFKKILEPMAYVVIACGYILMVVMIWMLIKFTYLYMRFDIAKQIKVPPLLPLFPYATDLFKVDFLPPFYFTYWIIVIAIIAITHEFAHGIYARLYKIKVKATGFGFLGPFLAAFVEPDEKQMAKAPKKQQLAILGAGTFANVLMTLLFGIILGLFFMASFAPAGINFNAYATNTVLVDSIDSVEGFPISLVDLTSVNKNLTKIGVDGETYLVPPLYLKQAIDKDADQIIVYENAPAVQVQLEGPITGIDGKKITSYEELGNTIRAIKPGKKVIVSTLKDGEEYNQSLVMGEKNGQGYLGIGIYQVPKGKLTGWFQDILTSVKDPTIYYEPSWGGDFAWFIYNLLWWIVIINISVALVNMLPVGIFDGGRFFYLTVWGITGKETWAKKAFSLTTWIALLIVILLMIRWALAFI